MPLEYTWSIIPTRAPADTVAAAPKPKTNLITGLIRPFRRVESDFASGFGDEEVMFNVGQVLGTARGTLPWEPSFGSDLDRLRHKANTPILRETARVYVDDALRKWSPVAALVDIEPPSKTKANEVALRITVRIGNKQKTLTQTL